MTSIECYIGNVPTAKILVRAQEQATFIAWQMKNKISGEH